MGAQTEEQAVNYKLEAGKESKIKYIYKRIRITFRRNKTKSGSGLLAEEIEMREKRKGEGEEGKQRSTAKHL